MRMILQGWLLVAAALICLTASGIQFYAEWDFGTRAVAVQATVTDRDIDISGRRHRTQYSVDLSFDLNGPHMVRAIVPRSRYLTLRDGDKLTLRVDPDTPRIFTLGGPIYALWGLIWAMVAMCLAVLSALSFATARHWRQTGVQGWTGAAFPWLADRTP